MEQNIFSPRLKTDSYDSLSGTLRSLAQGVLMFIFGLLPIFFIPSVYTSLGFTKIYFVALGIFAAIAFLSLSVLRSGSLRIVVPPALAFFWLFVIVSIASSLLSGDVQDSVYGNALEVHTSGFFALMALVMTVSLAFSSAKAAMARLFIALGIGAFLLQFFQILRLFFGPDFLSFGIFTSSTVSLVGSFNDLAIFSGLVIIITLIIMQQISSHIFSRIIAGFLLLSSLVLMTVINFYAVWLVVGFLSLLMFLYLISKDTWLRGEGEDYLPVPRFVLFMVGTVCVFSAAFIISGDYLGGIINKATETNYLEIRPSIGSTIDITSSVLSENALFGTGPNRFEDAWRQYKNPVINQTIFWNTNFSAGSGYVPTIFATTGIAGGIFITIFLLALIYLGYKTLFVNTSIDSGWYLVGTVSFIASSYLWLMAIIYVPGVVILLLAAFMTGLSFAVYVTVTKNAGVVIDVSNNKNYGLLLIAAVLIIIITSTLFTITISKQFLANIIYADTVRAFQAGADTTSTDEGLKRSQDLSGQDLFIFERAQLRLSELNRINALEAGDPDKQRFAAVLSEGIGFAEQALLLDSTNPINYILLSNFYSLLNPAEFEGLRDRNEALFEQARKLDTTNPVYPLSLAEYTARIGDLEASRKHLQDAILLKNDYTDALFLLSQLDIQEGKTEDAITLTRSIISIEPANPTRYFQLGVLLATTNKLAEATSAFETAVSIDNNYANARYFLALIYLDLDRKDDALTQLRLVQNSNPDNEVVKSLIEQVESNNYQKTQSVLEVPVKSSDVVTQQDDVTVSSELPNTDLVTPLNNSSLDGESNIQNEDGSMEEVSLPQE